MIYVINWAKKPISKCCFSLELANSSEFPLGLPRPPPLQCEYVSEDTRTHRRRPGVHRIPVAIPHRPGIKVDVFGDSNDLLAHTDPYGYDFYLVDLMLPGIDGVDLIRVLRRRSNAGVLVVSGRLAPTPSSR